jgi:hypothetical protein
MKMLKSYTIQLGLALATACSFAPNAFAAQPHVAAKADQKNLSAALQQYLARQGDLCLGKFDWPIDVSLAEFPDRSRNALQMPVLEKLGLVSASDSTIIHKSEEGSETTLAAKRYALTDVGSKYYIPRMSPALAGGEPVVHHHDFCAGKVSLKKIVHWETPSQVDGHLQTVVTYTYTFAPAAWANDGDIRRVFPMLDQVIKGQGSMELQQRLQLADGKWVGVSSL